MSIGSIIYNILLSERQIKGLFVLFDRKHQDEQCWCHDIVLFDPVCHRKWFRVLSIIQNTCLHVMMKLPHHGYESGWRAKLCHNFLKPISTDCDKCFGVIDKGHVEVHILFLTIVLKCTCCKDHVYCSSVFPGPTLNFWYKAGLIKFLV